MLNEDYAISITGKQIYESEVGEIKLDTVGSYSKSNGTALITYKEYDEDDPKLTHTSVLKIEKDRVTMTRNGTETQLVLEKGKRHLCLYDTGFGTLSVGVFTSELKSTLNSTGGAVNIKYTLDIDSNLSSRNEINVEVKLQDSKLLQ